MLEEAGNKNALLRGMKTDKIDHSGKITTLPDETFYKIIGGVVSYQSPLTNRETDAPKTAPPTTSAGKCLLSTTRLDAINVAKASGNKAAMETNR